MTIHDLFNRNNTPGITKFIEAKTGIDFTELNTKMRDESFTPEEDEAVEKALREWEKLVNKY